MADPNLNLAPARLSVAPMMDWTDRHCRYFHRVLSKRTVLFSEMVTSSALIRGGADWLIRFNDEEHPVVLQIGGSDPVELAQAAQMGVREGYDSIDLNVGCPSDRVQAGTFGAVLMANPELVRDCVRAMVDAVGAERVSVKCRLGIDDQEVAETLPRFIETVAASGVQRFTIHARKAWLKGLSPKENRDIPPLDYDLVRAMKARFEELWIGINGGITDLDLAQALLADGLDGVMIGRAAYHDPGAILLDADARIFGDMPAVASREAAVAAMLPYIEAQLVRGEKLGAVTRHMLGLFAGMPGARAWRRVLSEKGHRPGSGPEVVEEALAQIVKTAA